MDNSTLLFIFGVVVGIVLAEKDYSSFKYSVVKLIRACKPKSKPKYQKNDVVVAADAENWESQTKFKVLEVGKKYYLLEAIVAASGSKHTKFPSSRLTTRGYIADHNNGDIISEKIRYVDSKFVLDTESAFVKEFNKSMGELLNDEKN